MNKQNGNKLEDTESETDGHQVGWGLGGQGKREEMNMYKLAVTKQKVKYCIGNIVNHTGVLCMESDGYWKYWGDHFISYICLITMLYT